jgi:hypothetical protein
LWNLSARRMHFFGIVKRREILGRNGADRLFRHPIWGVGYRQTLPGRENPGESVFRSLEKVHPSSLDTFAMANPSRPLLQNSRQLAKTPFNMPKSIQA